tara:strand:+ start:10851 stop:11132 length:282 start_codon:yes stop_codon:yes gene_type:complete
MKKKNFNDSNDSKRIELARKLRDRTVSTNYEEGIVEKYFKPYGKKAEADLEFVEFRKLVDRNKGRKTGWLNSSGHTINGLMEAMFGWAEVGEK